MKTGKPIPSCIIVLTAMMILGCIFGASIQNRIGERNADDISFTINCTQIDIVSSFQDKMMSMAYERMRHREQHVVAFWCMWNALTIILCMFAEAVSENCECKNKKE